MAVALFASLKDQIDVANVTVRPFDGYIFLCGGPFDHVDDPEKIQSARHYAVIRSNRTSKTLAGRSVLVAESMTGLLYGSDFADLLEFESHLGALAACVIIFVESPGSIAELGSFAVMPSLTDKLFVVCEQAYDSETNPSYLFLGPIAMLRKRSKDRVQVFPMFGPAECCIRKANKSLLDECWGHIESEVEKVLKRPVPGATLEPTSLAHQMIMIVALCDLFTALRQGEVEILLKEFGVDASSKNVRRQIRVLQQVGLLRRLPYSNEVFYKSTAKEVLVTMRPPQGADNPIFDLTRFRSAIVQKYKSEDDKKWMAIKSDLREQGEAS